MVDNKDLFEEFEKALEENNPFEKKEKIKIETKSENEPDNENVNYSRQYWLEVANDRFARLISSKFCTLSHSYWEANPISIDLQKFGQIAHSFPVPSFFSFFELAPNTNPIYLIFDSRFVFSMIENVFGGGSSQPKIEGREFTPLETNIILELVKIFPSLFHQTYFYNQKLWPVFKGTEINPVFIVKDLTQAHTHYYECVFEIESSTNLSTMIILLPYSIINDKYEPNLVKYWIQRFSNWMKNLYYKFLPNKNILSFVNDDNLHSFLQVSRFEHPQVMAVLLNHLDPRLGAKLMEWYPAGIRAEVLSRLCRLNTVPCHALKVLNQTFKNSMKYTPMISKGNTSAKNIYRRLSPSTQQYLYEEIAEECKEMANDLKEGCW